MDNNLIEILISNSTYIGLALDIIGVCLIWLFGITTTIDHPEFNAMMDTGVFSGSQDEHDKIVVDSKKQIKIVKRWSRTGLVFLVIGFSFQILGSYESSKRNLTLKNENQELTKALGQAISTISGHLDNYVLLESSVMVIKGLSESNSASLKQVESEASSIKKQLMEIKKTNH